MTYAIEDRRAELWWALRSRVLTDEELAEVKSWDYRLAIQLGTSYFEHEIKLQFMNAMCNQFQMHLAAERDARDRRNG